MPKNIVDRYTYISTLAVLLVLSSAVFLVISNISDYDTFWHIANGKAMVDSGQIVQKEMFSYTAQGKPFNNHEWLYQLLSYRVYEMLGAPGIVAMKGVLTGIVLLLFLATARIFRIPALPASLLGFYVVVAGLSRFSDRPQLFSFVGISLIALVLTSYCRGSLKHRGLVIIPVAFLIWDCFHGALYGLLLFFSFMAGELSKPYLSRMFPQWEGTTPLPADRLKKLSLYGGITLAVMLISPFGLRSYDVFLNLINKNTEAQFVGEFLPTPHNNYYAFWVLLAATFIAVISRKRQIDPTNIAIFIPFAYLSIRYTRGMEAFNLVAYLLILRAMPESARKSLESQNSRMRIALMAAAIFCIGYAVWFKSFAQRWDVTSNNMIDDRSFGFGINENYFPVGSTRFIKEVGIGGNMFNSDRFGGYLAFFAYPEHRIFQYNHPTIFTHIYGFLHNPSERTKWNINYAVVARDDEYAMFQREGFVPVYWEPSAMLLVKNSPENKAIIERYGIRLFKPLLTSADFMSLTIARGDYPILMREMGTYLAYRRDDRVAVIFNQLIRRRTDEMGLDEKTSLIQNARRFNPAIAH